MTKNFQHRFLGMMKSADGKPLFSYALVEAFFEKDDLFDYVYKAMDNFKSRVCMCIFIGCLLNCIVLVAANLVQTH